jgi:sialidase-1
MMGPSFWRLATLGFAMVITAILSVALNAPAADVPREREPAISHSIIERAGPNMPRADTASVVEISRDRLMVVYHRYEPGRDAGHDHGLCRIWSKTSRDGGKTWERPRMLVDVAAGDMNVQAPALLRLASGDLLMICLRSHRGGASSTMCLFRSLDGGDTFVEQKPIWKRSTGQWLQGGASCLLQLRSGRLLLPVHGGTGNQWRQKNSAWCFLSDDGGLSWQQSKTTIELPKRGAMEPSVAELSDGTLVMSLRTQLGGPYLCQSTDRGDTWSKPRITGLEGGESCTCLRRIPGSDDLLLLWNNSKYVAEGHHHYGERTPLTAAVSSDGGVTWRNLDNIREGPKDEYTNLDCMFTSQGRAVVTYMLARPAWNRSRISLHAAIIDKGWFVAE